jgi:hypothetical protein
MYCNAQRCLKIFWITSIMGYTHVQKFISREKILKILSFQYYLYPMWIAINIEHFSGYTSEATLRLSFSPCLRTFFALQDP